MTDTPTGARRRLPELEFVNPGALEGRASLAFKALAAISAFGVVLALIPQSPPVSTLHSVVFNIGSAGLVVILALTALAIDRDEPWAIAAIRPLAALIAVAGLALVAFALAEGRLRVPLDTVLCTWVLLGRPHTRPMPRPDRRTFAAAGGAALLLAAMAGSGWLFRWGGVLDVQPSELVASMTADCTDHVPGDAPPEDVQVTYDWHWTTWRPMASGTDAVIIGWDGNDGAGKVMYFFGEIPDPPDGIHPGYRAYPSSDMASAVLQETRNHWLWGVKLDEQGYDPGHVEIKLHLVNDAPGGEPLRITATYIHEGAWRQDATVITCAW